MTTSFWNPILLSLKIALIATPITLVLGILLVKLLHSRRRITKLLIELLILLPLVLPPSVVGFILIIIFGRSSWLGIVLENVFQQSLMFTWWAAVIASTVVSIPLMYQSLIRGFSDIDRNIIGAAEVDGAGAWPIFWRMEVPLAFTSILSGIVLSFARAMGEFGATLMFAGNIPGKTQTTATAIYTAMETGDMKLAWTLVITLIILSFILLSFIQLLGYRKR